MLGKMLDKPINYEGELDQYLLKKFKIELSKEDVISLSASEPDQYIVEIRYPKGHKNAGVVYFNEGFDESIVRNKGEAQIIPRLLDAILTVIAASKFNKKVKARILIVRWSK